MTGTVKLLCEVRRRHGNLVVTLLNTIDLNYSASIYISDKSDKFLGI